LKLIGSELGFWACNNILLCRVIKRRSLRQISESKICRVGVKITISEHF